jgi:hypothetical protein
MLHSMLLYCKVAQVCTSSYMRYYEKGSDFKQLPIGYSRNRVAVGVKEVKLKPNAES